MKKNILKIGLLMLMMAAIVTPMAAQHQIPPDFCITADELQLYNRLNQYRKDNGMTEIPLSKSMSYVAKLHVSDLLYNRPDTGNCNLHSWSAQGDWVECCYGTDVFNSTCMTSKPKEMTTYPGKGYEIAFWESVDARPSVVFDLWSSSPASRDLILNRGIWKDFTWKAFGVGMLEGYAVVWYGAEAEADEGVKICGSNETAGRLIDKVKPKEPVANSQGVRYHLIIASFTDETIAKQQIQQYKARGFKNPTVIKSGDNYRVSLGSYATQEEAVKARKSLGEKYEKAWVMKN
ncbi:MAG: hypothetical protein EOM83_09065 [Clostridia bacterium]|nr:hypothetical protein [Clostridia bacterium]